MKTIITLIIAALAATSPVWAQSSDQFKQAMNDALGTMKTHSEKSPLADFLASANQFERIASAEPAQWLPRYYAGLNYVYLGFMGKDEASKDKYLDQADANLKAAETITETTPGSANDELAVLKAYIAQARMTVDPMNRWQEYGPKFQSAIDKAKVLNPNNPRPYVLAGTSLMYTPEQFGGGPANACPLLKQAAEKFATFKPASDFAPNWGKEQVEVMMAKCK